VAIISMAQHASPKVTGHNEALRTYPAKPSIVVSRKPDGADSSIPMVPLLPGPSVPLEPATAPLVDEGHRDEEEERHHRDDAEHPELAEVDRPGIHEHDLDVEDDEGHGHEVVLDREPTAADRVRGRVDSALVRLELGPVVALG